MIPITKIFEFLREREGYIPNGAMLQYRNGADEHEKMLRASMEDGGASVTWVELMRAAFFEAASETNREKLRDKIKYLQNLSFLWDQCVERDLMSYGDEEAKDRDETRNMTADKIVRYIKAKNPL